MIRKPYKPELRSIPLTFMDCPDLADNGMCHVIYHNCKRKYGKCECRMKKGICQRGYAR